MARRGRKRKTGERHTCGQLVRIDKHPDDKVRTSRQPHRRMLREDDRLDARAESPLGRLLLKGHLGALETGAIRYDAGIRFAQIVGAYRSVIEGPRGTAGAGRFSDCGGRCPDLRAIHGHDEVTCSCEQRKARYDGCFEALLLRGRPFLMAVNSVAVHREAILPHNMIYLIGGLDALVAHLGLTPHRNRGNYRNTNSLNAPGAQRCRALCVPAP